MDCKPDTIGFYTIDRRIGKGNFAEVRLATHRLVRSEASGAGTRAPRSTRSFVPRDCRGVWLAAPATGYRIYGVIVNGTRCARIIAKNDINRKQITIENVLKQIFVLPHI